MYLKNVGLLVITTICEKCGKEQKILGKDLFIEVTEDHCITKGFDQCFNCGYISKEKLIKKPTEDECNQIKVLQGEELEQLRKENDFEHAFGKSINLTKIKQTKTNESGDIVCPKCGSTQIQMVSRRWSLLSGFLTNKVDRVCVRCKNRF